MKGKKRLSVGFPVVLLLILVLSGCGKAGNTDQIAQNGLAVAKDGQVTLYLVDSFDKSYYDVDELTGMAVEEVADYNGKNRTGDSTPVVLEEVARVESSPQLVRVVYRFADASVYSDFQGESLYYETLSQALEARHIFSGAVLFDSRGEFTLDQKAAAKLGNNHVVVTQAKTRIRPPYEVLYYSYGVKLLEDGSVDTSECQEPAVLLLKK